MSLNRTQLTIPMDGVSEDLDEVDARFTVYSITLHTTPSHSWSVHKRYSECRALYDQLVELKFSPLPDFPPKIFMQLTPQVGSAMPLTSRMVSLRTLNRNSSVDEWSWTSSSHNFWLRSLRTPAHTHGRSAL